MVLDTLLNRLTAFRNGEDTAHERASGSSSTDNTDHETLTYAEQVEYGVDERDLPDEDRILRLLVTRGGRVDHSTALEATGWSADHLDRVVERMEDDGQVSAISVGRKRVVCRRGFEPKGYRSHLTE